MRRGRLFFSVCMCGIMLAAAPRSIGQINDPNIRYFGRWDFSNSSQYMSYWGGAYLKVKFTGTTAKIKLGNTSTYYAKIDNGPWKTYLNASGTLNLTPVPLANGTHTLSVAQGKDYAYVFNFQGLLFDTGTTTSPPETSGKMIEFIGDSITAGYTDSQANVSDYAWICAEALGCEHTQIAYPGIKLASGYPKPGMDTAYYNLQPINYSNSPLWNFTKYTPNIVVVNLGQNDGVTNVPNAVFQSKYTNLLFGIRQKFPNAELFAMRPFSGIKAAQTLAAVNARIAAGDAKVRYIDTTGWITVGTSDMNDGVHPSDSGQIKIANRLKPILEPFVLGTATIPVVSFAVPSANVTVNAGTTLYVKVNATDPDGISQVRLYKNGVKLARNEGGSPYEWGLASQNDPELKNLSAGTFVLTAQATDTKGTVGSSTALITVTVQAGNLAPYFTSNPFSKPDATVGVAYNEPFSGKAVDPEGGAMTFSKVSGPVWLSVTTNGNATGTPGSVDVGTNTFMVKVTDNVGLSATATMTIKVNAPTNPSQTVVFTSIGTEDGYLNESTETSNIGGGFNATGTAGAGLRIGDTTTKQQHKSVVSFDTSSLPDGAVITSATLKLKRGAISGTPTTLGLIKVDIKGGTGFNNVTVLSKEDFQATSDATGVATMSYPLANGTLSTGSLSAIGLTKVNKTGKTQLRVYFATDDDNDTASDYLGFYPSENATAANRPVLEVTYQ